MTLNLRKVCRTHLSARTSTPFNRRMMLTSDNSDPLEGKMIFFWELHKFENLLIHQVWTNGLKNHLKA